MTTDLRRGTAAVNRSLLRVWRRATTTTPADKTAAAEQDPPLPIDSAMQIRDSYTFGFASMLGDAESTLMLPSNVDADAH